MPTESPNQSNADGVSAAPEKKEKEEKPTEPEGVEKTDPVLDAKTEEKDAETETSPSDGNEVTDDQGAKPTAPAAEAPAIVTEEKKAETDADGETVQVEVKSASDAGAKEKETKSEDKSDEADNVKTSQENAGKVSEEGDANPNDDGREDAMDDADEGAAEGFSGAMDVEPTNTEGEDPEVKSPSKRGRPKKGEEKPKSPVPPTQEPTRRSGRERRERKSTEFLSPGENEEKPKVIPVGKGTKFQDIPNIVTKFKEITWSDPHLHNLHMLVLGRGKKKDFKQNLLQFSGLAYPEGCDVEAEQDKVKFKMYKLKIDELKGVMDLCDIERVKEDKFNMCDRFLAWLEEPKASGRKRAPASATVKKSPAKRKESPAAKKAGSAKKTPPAKKAKKETPKKSPKSSKKSGKNDGGIDFNIPGTNIDKIREKVKSIVETANRTELTVKGVRKLLEEWLDADLSNYKEAIRSLVMEVM
mmetsp:Transcript_8184/g.17407  ORF Transcript_8184/g.17407 Transcript_8184/m.17407 type:complete len:471 (+) Transcript_8184:104-1516(+)|eukprot:CAMPEP_0171353764 /NCGR_PEP_ID=MMETSP0878-20121228/44360_1 /TAXON_ID=67004 /ORGANISM="Thalassiosira weissflogii, Strain CCMP1336" /LENGTH=470 /DNA_ID=CAMNT_0011859719 /DNA_START=100 /DNA_END=1512 /DNA_ORIENTATION=+